MEDLAWTLSPIASLQGDNRPRLQSGGGFPRPLHLDKFPNFIFFYFWEITLSIRKDSMTVRAPKCRHFMVDLVNYTRHPKLVKESGACL